MGLGGVLGRRRSGLTWGYSEHTRVSTSAGAYLGRRPRAFRRRTCVGIHVGATTCLYHANANSTARADVCGAWTDLCVGRST